MEENIFHIIFLKLFQKKVIRYIKNWNMEKTKIINSSLTYQAEKNENI